MNFSKLLLALRHLDWAHAQLLPSHSWHQSEMQSLVFLPCADFNSSASDLQRCQCEAGETGVTATVLALLAIQTVRLRTRNQASQAEVGLPQQARQ